MKKTLFFIFLTALRAHAGWTAVAAKPSGGVGLMLLLPDGSVMAASRTTDPNENPTSSGSKIWYKLTPNSQGSYSGGTWTTLASSARTRLWYSSQILTDGRVFIAGGEYGTGGSSAEIYDPTTNTWTSTPAPGVFLSDSVSKMLPDGRVLVAPASGGVTLVYDPVANTWTNGPRPVSGANQNEVTWLKLPDDSILTVPTNSFTSQRFIPSTNTWITDGTVPVNLYSSVGSEIGGAFLLPNGEAFFIGGDATTALYTPSGNNTAGTWRAGPAIPNVPDMNGNSVAAGAPDAGSAMLVNGRILCSFSPQMFPNPSDPTKNVFPNPTSFAIYDPVANSFSIINGPTGATVNVPSYQNLMLALPSGEALYSNFSNQLYVYAPDSSPAPLAIGKPTIHKITPNADGSWHLTGTKLNGISEGSSYGDDAQMDTNFPVVRLLRNGQVIYGRTFNWSSTGVSTGSREVSTEFVLPWLPFEYGGGGTSSIQVVANGIASDPIPFGGVVWVDFATASFFRNGNFDLPWLSYAEGNNALSPGGIIRFKGPRSKIETGYFNKPSLLTASGGPVTIGR